MPAMATLELHDDVPGTEILVDGMLHESSLNTFLCFYVKDILTNEIQLVIIWTQHITTEKVTSC